MAKLQTEERNTFTQQNKIKKSFSWATMGGRAEAHVNEGVCVCGQEVRLSRSDHSLSQPGKKKLFTGALGMSLSLYDSYIP